MINKETITNLQNLSLKKLREISNEIQNQKLVSERKIITFSKNFTLSLSNYCQNQCGYCFYNHRIPKSGNEKNVVLINQRDINNLIEKGL
ncbi:MAG: hypothetical protein EU533_08910, partial [Promethearchaeota archaeon]